LQCSGYYHKPKVLKITQPQSVRLKAADVQLQRSERCSRRSRENSRLQPDDLAWALLPITALEPMICRG